MYLLLQVCEYFSKIGQIVHYIKNCFYLLVDIYFIAEAHIWELKAT